MQCRSFAVLEAAKTAPLTGRIFLSMDCPLNCKSLLSVRITKMKTDPRYFNVNRHTKICSEHFTSDDFINPYSSKKRLKADAVPSIFSWNIDKQENVQPVKRAALEKLNQWRTEELKKKKKKKKKKKQWIQHLKEKVT